jgi:uroporphyrinogen-III synthase
MSDREPLAGRRILVTRGSSDPLTERLRVLGATVIEVPTIRIAPAEDPAPLDAALEGVQGYDWIVFTSGNAVQAVADRLSALGRKLPPTLRVAAVGPATTARCREILGTGVDLEPVHDYRAEGLLQAFSLKGVAGLRVLVPASDRARGTLAQGLRDLGASVDALVAYRTVTPEGLAPRLATALGAGIDLVTLASPSAVEGYVAGSPSRGIGIPVAVLGPVTATAAREAGLDLRVVAHPSTVEGLVKGIVGFFGGA